MVFLHKDPQTLEFSVWEILMLAMRLELSLQLLHKQTMESNQLLCYQTLLIKEIILLQICQDILIEEDTMQLLEYHMF